MSDDKQKFITEADEIELFVEGGDAENTRTAKVTDFSIGWDSDVEQREPTCIAAGKTEHEFTIVFEPTLKFLLWLYGYHVAEE